MLRGTEMATSPGASAELAARPTPAAPEDCCATTLDALKVKISEGHSYSQDRKKYLDISGLLKAEPYATRRARESEGRPFSRWRA